MLEFLWPWMALALPAPLLIWWLAPRAQSGHAALHLDRPILWQAAETATRRPRARLKPLLALLAWVCSIVAATRPQWLGDPIELPTSGRDLMLAVDISGSMNTEDMSLGGRYVSRLAAVKAVVSEFVQRRQGDRIGLILFGTQAYLQAPLTFDRVTVKTLLDEAPVGIAGTKTAIGDALGLSVKHLRDRPSDSRVLILLTDGASNEGEVTPAQAAELAAHLAVKVYTIGIGASEMTVPGLFGSRRVNPSADLDEATLRLIADSTGGRYFRAQDPQQLAAIYALLDELEPIDQDNEIFRPTTALFHWPLAGCLILVAGLLAGSGVGVRWPGGQRLT